MSICSGGGSWRLQCQVNEIKSVLSNPVDFRHRIVGRMVHGSDLHESSFPYLVACVRAL